MATDHPPAPEPSGASAENEELASSLVRRIDRRGHAPGDILAGKYQIVGLLGEGGMGTVWRARSLLLEVDVAIKVLHRERADLNAAERLLREARATAKLGHPAIVRAFDLGETDAGEPFLVMELLEGTSLAGWLSQRGRMSATQAVQMLLPIAGALSAAHKQGIVHRDIKPENIILVPDGDGTYLPKIVDFGIAKLLDGSGRREVLTQTGMILGSLEYMSPEQAEGREEVGEQTDVWALCVVLYELISGRRPFDGPTVTALMFALYTRAPTPTTRYAAGDDELWEIIEQGLQKSPTDRWPSMRALGHALAFWAAQRGITTDAAGMSLEHHWLGRASEPVTVQESEGVISPAASTGAAAAWPRQASTSLTLAPAPAAPPSEPPAALHIGLAVTTRGPPRPGARSRLLGPVAALLIVVPAIVFAGILARRGDLGARASAHPMTLSETTPAAAQGPTSIAMDAAPQPTAESSVEPPGTLPGPSATAFRPRSSRATPAGLTRRAPAPMPLPVTPNF